MPGSRAESRWHFHFFVSKVSIFSGFLVFVFFDCNYSSQQSAEGLLIYGNPIDSTNIMNLCQASPTIVATCTAFSPRASTILKGIPRDLKVPKARDMKTQQS